MKRLGQARCGYTLLFLSLAKGEPVFFGLHLDAQKVTLERNSGIDGMLKLLKVVSGNPNSVICHTDSGLSLDQIEVALGCGQNAVLCLRFESIICRFDKLARR